MFLSGFFHIKTETVSIRKRYSFSYVNDSTYKNSVFNSRGSNGAKESSTVKHGHVIVANWTSYIDIVYLASRYDFFFNLEHHTYTRYTDLDVKRFNPVFTQIFMDTNKVKIISLWEAIRLVGKMPESKPSSSEDTLYTVQELSQKASKGKWGPVVVFAEGTTTNGRALLKFAPVFEDYRADQKDGHFHIMAFKYEYGNMPPTFTVGNQFYHFFKLCSQVRTSVVASGVVSDLNMSCSFTTHLSSNHLLKVKPLVHRHLPRMLLLLLLQMMQ